MDNARGIGMGILVGLIAGAAVGMLYAPRPGKETREMVGDKMQEFRDKASDMTSKIAHRPTEIK